MGNTITDEARAEQQEALLAVGEYAPKLINGLKVSSKELKGELLEDTYEFLRKALDGFNWVLQVVNGCLDVLNENKVTVDKNEVNIFISKMNTAYQNKENSAIADIIDSDIIPFIEKVKAFTEAM